VITDDDDAAAADGASSTTATATATATDAPLPPTPTQRLLQQKRKPVKTFKATATATATATGGAVDEATATFGDSDDDRDDGYGGGYGSGGGNDSAAAAAASLFARRRDPSTSAAAAGGGRSSSSSGGGGGGGGSAAELSRMLQSTDDFVRDFRTRLTAQLAALQLALPTAADEANAADTAADGSGGGTGGAGSAATATATIAANGRLEASAAAKERLFALLHAPSTAASTAAASTAAVAAPGASSTRSSGGGDDDAQAQLSLYHKMLLSRRLLWDGLAQLRGHVDASRERVRRAQVASWQRIAAAAAETRATVAARHATVAEAAAALARRGADDAEALHRSVALLQATQAQRRATGDAVYRAALRHVVHALRVKHADLAAQQRQFQRQHAHVRAAVGDLAATSTALQRDAQQRAARAVEAAAQRRYADDPAAWAHWKRVQQTTAEAQHLLHEMTLAEHDALLQAREHARTRKIHRLLARLHDDAS
jgi:hypothetical protein